MGYCPECRAEIHKLNHYIEKIGEIEKDNAKFYCPECGELVAESADEAESVLKRSELENEILRRTEDDMS